VTPEQTAYVVFSRRFTQELQGRAKRSLKVRASQLRSSRILAAFCPQAAQR